MDGMFFTLLCLLEGLIEFIKENPILTDLLNNKDVNGNTPLHVLAVFHKQSFHEFLRKTMEELKYDVCIINNKNISVKDVASPSNEYDLPELKQQIRRLSNKLVLDHIQEGLSKPAMSSILKSRSWLIWIKQKSHIW